MQGTQLCPDQCQRAPQREGGANQASNKNTQQCRHGLSSFKWPFYFQTVLPNDEMSGDLATHPKEYCTFQECSSFQQESSRCENTTTSHLRMHAADEPRDMNVEHFEGVFLNASRRNLANIDKRTTEHSPTAQQQAYNNFTPKQATHNTT